MSSPSEPTDPRWSPAPRESTPEPPPGDAESDTQMIRTDAPPPRSDEPRPVLGAEEPEAEPRTVYSSDEPRPDREPGRGVARHVVALLIGFGLTPVGIGLLAYGGYRYQQVYSDRFVHDDRGLIAFGAGGLVLLLVAFTAALSPVGPMVGGLVYGLLPAGLFLAIPDDAIGWVADSPLFPDGTDPGTVLWMGSAVCLVVGVTLVGAALAATVRRR